MQTLINRTVRELAREYFNGQLSFDDYRNKRRLLVDQITGFDAGPEVDLYGNQEVEKTALVSDTIHEVVVEPVATEQTVSGTGRFPLSIFLLLVIGGFVATGGLVFFWDRESTPEPAARIGQTPAPAARVPMETDPTAQLVTDFVQADNWNDDALAAFVLSWSALNTEDQERARATAEFRLLVDGLREEILEQRALGDIAPGEGREIVLLSFAKHLGVLDLLTNIFSNQ